MINQTNITNEFPYKSEYVTVNNFKIHYVQSGTNDPPILLLHGIPVNVYLWRNVIPRIAPYAKTVAVDLLGFGQSDKPTNIEYNLQTYTTYLKNTIEALNLKNIIIVGMDLGLIVGLNYAMQNETNVRGVVMFEGFFQPMNLAYKNLPFINRLTFKMMKKKKTAERMLVNDGIAMVERMVSMLTIRKLSKAEIEKYQTPLNDVEVRRKVWLEGIGPATIKPKSEHSGDIADLINQYAAKLSISPIPKLLLYAKPGMVVSKKAVEYARKNIANLELKFIGAGKHFLPEDQPDNIGQAIADFYRNLG